MLHDQQRHRDRPAATTHGIMCVHRAAWLRAGGCHRRRFGDGLLNLDSRVGNVVQSIDRILLETATQQGSNAGGVSAGNACQSGSCFNTAATVSEIVSAANAAAPSAFRTTRSRRPRYRFVYRRPVRGIARAHVACRAENGAFRVRSMGGVDIRRDQRRLPQRSRPSQDRNRAPSPCRQASP